MNSFSDDLVQLKVDAVHATFNVHRKVLSASSKFFQAALKREWASSRSDPKIIDLSDDGYTIVHAYLHWLYTQQFITCIGGMLISAYIFGEKVMDIKYKNAVLQKIMAERIPTRSIAWAANKIYGGSPPSPPARRLMADMVADLAQKGDEWNFVFERLNNKVLVDAMKVMVEVRRAPNTRSWMVSKVKYLEEDHEPQASV